MTAREGDAAVEGVFGRRALAYLLVLCVAISLFPHVFRIGSHAGLIATDRPRAQIGPDFVAFYVAGQMVANGDGERVLDFAEHRRRVKQLPYFEELQTAFPYPAYVALLYVPLGLLSFDVAYAVFTLAMIAATIATLWLLREASPTTRRHPVVVGVGLLAYSPFGYGLFAGVGLPISLLLLAGTYVALRAGREREAGVWIGLLLYKPQLALPLLALMVWGRRWRTIPSFAFVAVVYVALGLLFVSPSWPSQWLRLVSDRAYLEYEMNCCGDFHASVPGVVDRLSSGQVWPLLLVGIFGLAIMAATLRAWWRVTPTSSVFPLQFGLALVAAVMLSPHALFYETTLLLIPLLVLLDHWRDLPASERSRRSAAVIVGLLAIGVSWPLVRVVGVQPLVVVPLVLFGLLWRALPAPVRTAPTRDPVAPLRVGTAD